MATEFYVRMFDDPRQAETYGRPAALFRWNLGADGVPREMVRWDGYAWVAAPTMINLSGMGGADDFWRVDDDEAERILQEFGGQPDQLRSGDDA